MKMTSMCCMRYAELIRRSSVLFLLNIIKSILVYTKECALRALRRTKNMQFYGKKSDLKMCRRVRNVQPAKLKECTRISELQAYPPLTPAISNYEDEKESTTLPTRQFSSVPRTPRAARESSLKIGLDHENRNYRMIV